MTVRDLVNDKSYKDRPIRLGCVDGCSFLYCGIARTLPANEISKDLLYRRLTSRISNENGLASLTSMSRSYESFVRNCAIATERELTRAWNQNGKEGKPVDEAKIRAKYTPTPEKHKAWLKKLDHDTARRLKLIEANKAELAGFKHLSDRRVVEVFASTVPWEPSGTLVCMIEGDDDGKYWDMQEYKRAEQNKEETKEE